MFNYFLLHLFNKPKIRIMSEETNNDQEEILGREQLTPEEYEKARKDAADHLKKEITFLKVEKEYQTLLADVEEAKTRRITMVAQQARFFPPKEGAPQMPQEDGPKKPPTPQEPSKPRTLKKQ